MALDPRVWLPKFIFTIQTIAVHYPPQPNDVAKKKYYELVQNIPFFLPDSPLGATFTNLLDSYPVTPYLDSRSSFLVWVHLIKSHLQQTVDLPTEDFETDLHNYYDEYRPKEIIDRERNEVRKKRFSLALTLALGTVIFMMG
ncbi:hypothetical protein [uncultured Mediterranean phage]|nr:hypothetical protein [uncultured Mediterranean phage]